MQLLATAPRVTHGLPEAITRPLAEIPLWIHRLVRLYQAMRFYGAPLASGGAWDQPYRLTLQMQIVEDELAHVEERRRREEEALRMARQRRPR